VQFQYWIYSTLQYPDFVFKLKFSCNYFVLCNWVITSHMDEDAILEMELFTFQ